MININSDSHNPNEETISATTNDETQQRLRQIFDQLPIYNFFSQEQQVFGNANVS